LTKHFGWPENPADAPTRWVDKTAFFRGLTTFFGGLARVAWVVSPEYAQLLLRVLGKPRGNNPQHRRRITKAQAKLNQWFINLGVWADDPELQLLPSTGRPAFGLAPSPKNDMKDFRFAVGTGLPPAAPRVLGNVWGTVGDHHDIAPPRRAEEYQCRHIAAHLGFAVDTERRRIEDLNLRHEARLESLTGKTIEIEEYIGDGHAVGDLRAQAAAIEMTFEDVGFGIENRRNRENEFLEPTEKLLTKGKRRGKPYRPNKAGPCRTLIRRGAMLDGWASWDALFDASRGIRIEKGRPKLFGRPAKKGSQYFKNLKPSAPKERGLFGSWRTAPVEVYTSDFKAEQELQDTRDFDLSAMRSRRQRKRDVRQIVVTDDWGIPFGEAGHSYADELMTFAAKKPPTHEWGETPFLAQKHEYDVRSAAWDMRRPSVPVEIPIPYHEAYAIEPILVKL
jgi:hypothetical protein